MKAKCSKCREQIEIDRNRYDEGDCIECPECGAVHIIVVKKGKFYLEPERSKYDEYEEEFYSDDYGEE